ncbi:2-oxoglutarate (2OG) and Fe(II)-dependent oxygenase superfamily protein [Rhynchospora pubera]|uniref:2-oxoglutarate-dependent dioxygenase DAO n=1 Tax=Rhynchospora pubera TaxID=906938 RepID=A0AAV8F7Z7_9POAL|nr:2-oxoglutarate (2OG) and Fe(II)-dependent oxygenase superfamily protein [Rhynchospora pubera]KAJ4787092.1 2-oxoglutarate (2OG) and Fe(II)-dependent oxygenase superfamily protein [Rhynchospora pubera]
MATLPVIDLAEFSDQNQRKNMLEASRYWGCFRVINHSFPVDLQSQMKAAVTALFDLPADIKRRNADANLCTSGYVVSTPENPLYEGFGVYDASSLNDVDAFCSLLDTPIHVRETIKTYAQKSRELIVDIAMKLGEMMGLKDQNFGAWPCHFRFNKYNFTQDSVGSHGVQIHTDSGFLTLLKEDECVGGLEILDPVSGSFIEVDPLPGSFLVNFGDVAKAWSNGILCNVKHRVICKAAIPRFSVALFLLAPKDDKVESPPALIDSDHPRMYQTFTYDDYRKLCFSTELHGGEALSLLLM